MGCSSRDVHSTTPAGAGARFASVTDWLHRLTPRQWLDAGLHELGEARGQLARRAARPALASARRAAGMAWNAVLALEAEPPAVFGRTYVEHLVALAGGAVMDADDPHPIPPAVREAARTLLEDPAAGPTDVVQILTPRRDRRVADAAETILAEAYARLIRKRADVEVSAEPHA